MGTTVETGSNFSAYTTESKFRFKKGDAPIAEGVQFNTTDSVASYDPATQTINFKVSDLRALFAQNSEPAAPQGPPRYSSFDRQTKLAYRDTVKNLADNGRLYVREENGLRRANPMEIKERLDQGLPIEVVTRVGSETSSNSYSEFNSFDKERGLFSAGANSFDRNDWSTGSQRVFYSSSSIREWDSLDWADLDGKGVRGVANLPPSGGSVVVSRSFESSWEAQAHREWGLWTSKEEHAQAGGHKRVNYTAD